MGMNDFADHVVSVANDFSNGVSNLQLHKVMYFTLGNYIKDNKIDKLVTEIYDEPFEAWPYGPVVRSEYFKNRKYGRYKIRKNTERVEKYDVFNEYILELLNNNVNDLVEESHLHSTWLNNKEKILLHELVEYSLEDIENDFA